MNNINHYSKYQLHDNTVEVVYITDINDWPVIKQYLNAGKKLMVFLVNEISINDEEIEEMTKKMIKLGLALFSSRGVDSDKIEDIVDHVCVLNYLGSNHEKDLDIPTTSHNDESLNDALNLFAHGWLEYDRHQRLVIVCSENKKTFIKINRYFKKQEVIKD